MSWCSLLVIISVVLFVAPRTTIALDCAPLDPRQQVGERAKSDIEGSAATLFKVGKFQGSYKSETEREVKNLYDKYPEADKLVIKGKLIYFFCTYLHSATDLDSEAKFQKFMIFSKQVMDVPIQQSQQPTSTREAEEKEKTKEAENFTFRLQGCVLSTGDVTCDFTVTNTGSDVLLTLRSSETNLFDDLGGKYALAKAWIGNEGWSGPWIHAAGREMILNVPVQTRLVFSGLPQGATKITKLIVAAKRGPSMGGRGFSLSFRDIALSPE